MERRGRRRLAEVAERRGRVSSTQLRGYDTTLRRLDHFESMLSKSACAVSADVCAFCEESATSAFSILPTL